MNMDFSQAKINYDFQFSNETKLNIEREKAKNEDEKGVSKNEKKIDDLDR